ncbi:MAG: 50S ribosomal protein L30 [Chloroflexota bacterium]|nr:MAG: 50S ribosomal protein L30 [Chloroflexota bacterium]
MPRQLEVTYTRSGIGHSERQRRTLEALGLRKLHDTVRHHDQPSIRGMISRVHHLVNWCEVEEGEVHETT